ncbi:GNAT family N-acetyltransferase [Lacticaseibacillus paracasei]|uniref:GNAT family N-acetyltransferase n=1 Tax=Lacticaseibacillus paracasei TaxID=1597 RepID=UPI0015FC5D38|nr:GNAT family N-acetyltransferase [Lacticaseibacillus paracasei]MBB1166942.1 GNAT family N-acetyltransferase [Lacticaseibacillus paracasei]
MEDNIRKSLVIKPVTPQDLEQFNDLLTYVFQVTQKDLEQSGYEEGELERAKRPVLEKSDVLGWFHKDELVSSLAIYPCTVNIHGTLYKMAGLTGVGTYPEYAGHGLMHDLVRLGLQHMRDHKQWISYLYPYSIPFYRKKGWEIMSDHLTFDVKDTQLPKQVNVPGHVERLEIEDPDVIETYNRFAMKNHGAMIRNQLNWDEYWRWENEEERTAGVYYDANDEPQGYVLYWIADEVFHVKEMIYTNQEARVGLWNFISAHFSMVTHVKGNIYKNEPLHFLLDDGDIYQTIKPYFMARIVDVKAFLKQYPFAAETPESFHFVVTDPLAPWNNGTFGVYWDEKNQIQITDRPVGEEIKTDIQTLTTMLMSYRRPSYLAQIERLFASKHAIKLLENAIPMEEPYFSDYF